MTLIIMSQNLKHGAIQTGDGRPDDRWPTIAADIRKVKPDLLCLQECHGWSDRLHAQMYRAESDLGMRTVGLVRGRTDTAGCVLLYRPHPGLSVTEWATDYERELFTGLGVGLFEVDGLPGRLAVAGVHLTTVTPEATAAEAMRAANRIFAYDGYGLMIGDINVHPLNDGGRAPDPATVKPLDRAARWDDDGQPDRLVARRLARAELVDAADHLARATGDQTLYAPTGHGGIRVDQAHLTPMLAPMLADYWMVETASDHAGVVITIDVKAP